MSATNATTYYELPVFIATDKPAWLTDWNGAMNAIDTAIKEALTAGENAQTTANTATTSIATINDSLTTINTSLSTLTSTTTGLVGSVNTINSLIGNGEPTTSDKTLIGAINEIYGMITGGGGGNEIQAENVVYDNTTSGLTADDVQAAIDEVLSMIPSGPSTHQYSTTEQVVAKWIDNADVYEKVVDTGALPNNTTKNVAHGISNIGVIISAIGFAQNSTNNNGLTLPFVDVSGVQYSVGVQVDDTDVKISAGSDRTGFDTSYVVLRYTKATV